MPLDPTVARKLREIDEEPVEIMNNLEAYEEKKMDGRRELKERKVGWKKDLRVDFLFLEDEDRHLLPCGILRRRVDLNIDGAGSVVAFNMWDTVITVAGSWNDNNRAGLSI